MPSIFLKTGFVRDSAKYEMHHHFMYLCFFISKENINLYHYLPYPTEITGSYPFRCFMFKQACTEFCGIIFFFSVCIHLTLINY